MPCYLHYKSQLRSRRLWRQKVLEERLEMPAACSTDGEDRYGEQLRDKGLDLHPVWRLHMPEGVAFLVLSYVAGTHAHLLQYLI